MEVGYWVEKTNVSVETFKCVDDLFSVAVMRYHNEKPDVNLTDNMLDAIWFSVYGALNEYGVEKAYAYVKTAELLFPVFY